MIRLLLASVVGLCVVLAEPLDGIDAPSNENNRQTVLNFTDYPYQVLISELEESPRCGGVLVAPGYILTSATCVLEFGGIKKFLEEAVLYGGGVSLLVDLGDVSDALIHPKYTVNPTAYDVAVVRYIVEDKGPRLSAAVFNGTLSETLSDCVLTSWWVMPDVWPERLMRQTVSLSPCEPADPSLLCVIDEGTVFLKNDYGSPIVCQGVLTGMVPRGGGKRAINLTSDYDWISETMAEMAITQATTESAADEETKLYLTKILQKLDHLTLERPSREEGDQFTHWNNQIVIPLSYVLFSMVIFFFVLLFFIVLFTVVLVYYSRK